MQDNFLNRKTIFITGASSGIGESLATHLSAFDVTLTLLARRKEKLRDIKDRLANQKATLITASLDVSDRQAVTTVLDDLLQQHQPDILINNAGLALDLTPLDQGDPDQWEIMIDTNIKGLLYVTRKVMAAMRQNNRGHIVNIGSVAGKTAYPGGNVYCATKAAVHALTEAMNTDLVTTGIKVSTIAPGAVETEFSNIRFGGDTERAAAVYEGYTPLTAEDIAHTIIHVINTPPHVNIQHVDIMPTAQRNPYLLARNGP